MLNKICNCEIPKPYNPNGTCAPLVPLGNCLNCGKELGNEYCISLVSQEVEIAERHLDNGAFVEFIDFHSLDKEQLVKEALKLQKELLKTKTALSVVREKFKSGNSVKVPQITIKREEVEEWLEIE